MILPHVKLFEKVLKDAKKKLDCMNKYLLNLKSKIMGMISIKDFLTYITSDCIYYLILYLFSVGFAFISYKWKYLYEFYGIYNNFFGKLVILINFSGNMIFLNIYQQKYFNFTWYYFLNLVSYSLICLQTH